MFNSFLLRFILGAVSAAACLPVVFGQTNDSQCRVDFYYTPGCEQCRQVGENMFSQIGELFGDRVSIRQHNLYDSGEYAEMLKTRAALGIERDDNVFFIIDGSVYVGGLKDIRANLIAAVEERLLSGPGLTPPGPESPAGGGYSFPCSLSVLLIAGLVDGINPCAFAAIVFLISSLLAGGGRRANLFLIGLGFCISVYLTYFLLGLGLFQVFRLSFMRLWLGNIVNWLLIAGLLVMAFVSFRDARQFRRTGRPKDVVLKLPGPINRLVHAVIRSNLPRKHYFAGSFLLGCAITLLESVCTGQLYVPALAFLARASPMKIQAVLGLALYNIMFVLPLVAVFGLAYYGASHRAFIEWSKKDFFWAKCALGCVFVFLAVLLYWA